MSESRFTLDTAHALQSKLSTEADACAVIAVLGYQPITRLGHIHAIHKTRDVFQQIILDERHICLVEDLPSMEKRTLLALVETAFRGQGIVRPFLTPPAV